MSRTERIRARTERMRAALAAKPAPATTPPPPAPEKSAKEKRAEKRAASPVLTHSCGHTRPIIDLEHIACPACQDKCRRERAARRRAARDAKREAKSTVPDAGRLPDGSRFTLEPYDGVNQRWTGSLEVGGVVFTASESGIFKLLRTLDVLYRQSLSVEGK